MKGAGYDLRRTGIRARYPLNSAYAEYILGNTRMGYAIVPQRAPVLLTGNGAVHPVSLAVAPCPVGAARRGPLATIVTGRFDN